MECRGQGSVIVKRILRKCVYVVWNVLNWTIIRCTGGEGRFCIRDLKPWGCDTESFYEGVLGVEV